MKGKGATAVLLSQTGNAVGCLVVLPSQDNTKPFLISIWDGLQNKPFPAVFLQSFLLDVFGKQYIQSKTLLEPSINVLSRVITKLWVGEMLCSLTQQMSLRILTTPPYWPFGAVTKCPSGTGYFSTQGQGLCYNLQGCFASSLWVCGVAEYHSGEGTAEWSPRSHLMGLRHKKFRGRRRGLGDEIRSPSSPPCNWDLPPKFPPAPNTLSPKQNPKNPSVD